MTQAELLGVIHQIQNILSASRKISKTVRSVVKDETILGSLDGEIEDIANACIKINERLMGQK